MGLMRSKMSSVHPRRQLDELVVCLLARLAQAILIFHMFRKLEKPSSSWTLDDQAVIIVPSTPPPTRAPHLRPPTTPAPLLLFFRRLLFPFSLAHGSFHSARPANQPTAAPPPAQPARRPQSKLVFGSHAAVPPPQATPLTPTQTHLDQAPLPKLPPVVRQRAPFAFPSPLSAPPPSSTPINLSHPRRRAEAPGLRLSSGVYTPTCKFNVKSIFFLYIDAFLMNVSHFSRMWGRFFSLHTFYTSCCKHVL